MTPNTWEVTGILAAPVTVRPGHEVFKDTAPNNASADYACNEVCDLPRHIGRVERVVPDIRIRVIGRAGWPDGYNGDGVADFSVSGGVEYDGSSGDTGDGASLYVRLPF